MTLVALLDSIGKYQTEQKKDSIQIVRDRAFIGIHPKKNYLGVNVVLNRPKASPAADKVEQVSANGFHHYYKRTSMNWGRRPIAIHFAKGAMSGKLGGETS